jgi:hypothetical protein
VARRRTRRARGHYSSAIGAFTGAFNDAGTVWLDHLDIGYWNGHGISVAMRRIRIAAPPERVSR